MSFFRFQFLSTQFLAVMLTVIAYDKRYFQESIGNGRKVNLENSILQHYDGQKPEVSEPCHSLHEPDVIFAWWQDSY
jgi:hypothetical protein